MFRYIHVYNALHVVCATHAYATNNASSNSTHATPIRIVVESCVLADKGKFLGIGNIEYQHYIACQRADISYVAKQNEQFGVNENSCKGVLFRLLNCMRLSYST